MLFCFIRSVRSQSEHTVWCSPILLTFFSDSAAFEKVLQQSVDGNCSRVFSKGNHCFSFYVVLPSDVDLPPSLEGKFGFIRYWLRGVIERGRGKSDLKTSDERILIGDNASTEDFEEALVSMSACMRIAC